MSPFSRPGTESGAQRAARLEQAIAAHRAGHTAEARAAYERMLALRPEDPDALNFLGLLEFQGGAVGRGIELLGRSVLAAPGNVHAWINLGTMLMFDKGADAAINCYERALECDATVVEAWYDRGICELRLGRFDAAASSLRRALEIEPRYTKAYEQLGTLLFRAKRFDEARELYRAWCGFEPEHPVARHMLAAMGEGPTPERAQDAYVTHLFDRFAPHFDARLGSLGYQVPQQLVAALAGQLTMHTPRYAILDAGCGTGLCGILLRSSATHLTGVDLSPAMVERARARAVYDELAVGELVAFMGERPQRFDIVVAGDTLCYFGELAEAMRAVERALRGNGVLAFTVEALADTPGESGRGSEGIGYRIQPSGRYVHAREYVAAVLLAAGFQILVLEDVVARQEGGADVRAFLAVARRGAAPQGAAEARFPV